jgi:hypothetical protein
MKNMFFAFALVAVFAAAFAVPAGAVTYASNLNVVLTNQTPYPVEPGSNVDVGVQLQNTGRDNAQNVYLEMVSGDPFRLLPGQEAIKFFSQVPALDSVKASYKLNVNSSAITNNYELAFKLYFSDQPGSFITKTVNINVQGVPDLVIDGITTSPSSIEPGGITSIKATVMNVGTGSVRNLQVSFDSSFDEIKPILSKGTVFVGDIAPGRSKDVTFDVSVDSAAEEKTYTVTLAADYKDENNNAITESFPVGLPVSGSISLDIIKIDPLADRDALRIEMANKGTASAKSIEATLIVNNKTVDVNYVSELKATKKTTMDFSPLPMSGGVAQLSISYIGPGLEKNSITKEVSLNFQNGGSSGGDGVGVTIIAVIVIAVVVYYFWRKRKKAAKHRRE